MALMQCPECNKEVSDQCGTCPHCGFPVERHLRQEKEKRQAEQAQKGSSFGICFLRRCWIIAVTMAGAAVLMALLAVGYAQFFVPPTYSTKVMMYVDMENHSDDFNITSEDLIASQTLIKSYKVIIETPETLHPVIEKTGNKYSYDELLNMISVGSVNNTELFYIRVEAPDPEDAALIANTICEVLPERINETFKGSSTSQVQEARVPDYRSAPVLTDYAFAGALIGMVLGVVVSTPIVIAAAARRWKKEKAAPPRHSS